MNSCFYPRILYISTVLYFININAFVPAQQIAKQQLEKLKTQKHDLPMKNLEIPKQVKSKRVGKYNTRRKHKKKYTEPKKTLRAMTYEEVKTAKNRLVATNNRQAAIPYLERMLKLCDDLSELANVLLEFAHIHQECGHFQKATQVYNEFVSLYPGSDKVEYALYQSIVCSSKLILSSDRDQTKTHETIELCDQFLEREEIFTNYKPEVKKIQTQCYNKLIASDFNVCDFFLKSGRYKQAQKRLDTLREKWVGIVDTIEPQILAFECDLANAQQNETEAAKKLKELETQFPEFATKLTQNKKSKVGFVHRF